MSEALLIWDYKRNMQEELPANNLRPRLTLSIAPMIDVSNTHFRYFMRLITKVAPVYTEMLHHDAVIHSHRFLLPFSPEEHPIVLQLGGSDPSKLAEAALLGQKYGYDEINLNIGCPSPRVQKGAFGACLMKEPELVRECMQAMQKAVKIPCTVKCRLGIDDFDSYEFAREFVAEVSRSGKGPITHFIIHARKAFLTGLNPSQNRTIPPLMYDRVYKLQQDFPSLTFEINGGLKSIVDSYRLCRQNGLTGAMVGRLAYQNPFELMKVDEVFGGKESYKSRYPSDAEARRDILHQFAAYLQRLSQGEVKDEFGNVIHTPNPSVLVKPVINFYNGEKYSGKYRQYLSDLAKMKKQPVHVVVRQAANMMWEGGFRAKWEKENPLEVQKEENKETRQAEPEKEKQQGSGDTCY